MLQTRYPSDKAEDLGDGDGDLLGCWLLLYANNPGESVNDKGGCVGMPMVHHINIT